MAYKSKQILSMRAKLVIVTYIRDLEGHRSYQMGTSFGVPSDELDAMIENAVLNAVYKHMGLKGMQFANGGSYDYKNIVTHLKIKNYWFEYFSENKTYGFKVSTFNNKRYMVIRKRGKIYKRSKFTYSRKRLTDEYEI